MSKVKYEYWGSPEGREGIQRTLDDTNADDMGFLEFGIRTVDEHGNMTKLTTEQANKMGIRRLVASKDIHTGEIKFKG